MNVGDHIILASPPTQRCARCGAEWWDAHVCPRTFNTTTQPLAPNVSPPNEIDTLRASIAELESALAKSASREAALVEKLNVADMALSRAKRRFELLAVHDNTMRNSVLPSAGFEDAEAALAKIKEAS